MAEKQDVPLMTETENDEKKEEEKDHDSESDESEEEEDDTGDENLFEVEKIISRKKRNGAFLYRVRWKGYSPSSDTWEPQENLDIVADMVREFDALQDKKAKSRQEERRIRKLRMEGKKLPGEESSDDDTDSSKEESQLCETTRFFKRLEKDKDLVWSQPDLYSKVKSRAASLVSKKQEEITVEPAVPTSSAEKAPPSQSESLPKRGRGRPRGGGTPREKGAGRGRGRPLKKTVGSSSDEGEDQKESSSQLKGSGPGRGRPGKKSGKDSLSDTDSDDLSSESDDSRTGADPGVKAGVKERSGEKEDSSDCAPLADLHRSKKCSKDTSEEKKDSEESVPAKKTTSGKPRGRPPKKAATENNKDKGELEDSTPAAKGAGRGRGRPKKMAKETSEDTEAEPDKAKGKGRGRGRPKKKSMAATSEDHDSADRSVVHEKTKGKGKGRPKKLEIDSSDENEDSDDLACPVKSSTVPPSQKLTSDSSDEDKPLALPVLTKKKKEKGHKKPRKNLISDTSEDSESDNVTSVTKNSPVIQDRSKASKAVEHSDKNDSEDDTRSSSKKVKQENQPHKVPEKAVPAEEVEESVASSEQKTVVNKAKGKGKARKKLVIRDSDDNISDDSLSLKEKSEPPSIGEEKKKKKKKDAKPKNEHKDKKQQKSSKESTAKKKVAKKDKISAPGATSKVEETVPPLSTSQESETKPGAAVVVSGNTVKKAEKDIPPLPSSAAKVTPEHSSILTVPVPSARSKSKAVIPVLEKFAMSSVTDSFALEPEDKGSGESKAAAAAVSGIKEEKSEPKSSQKIVNKDSKEDSVLQKKSLSKGQQKSMKRKLDTAVKHAMAVKEGEASPMKVASLKSPSSAELKGPAPLSFQCLDDSLSAAAASPEPPPSPPEKSAISVDPSVDSGASSKPDVAHTDSALEVAKPVSSPAQKQPKQAKGKLGKSKVKTGSSKSQKTDSKSKSSSAKGKKQKSGKDGKAADKNTKAAVQIPSSESGLPSLESVADAASDEKMVAQNKELSTKSALLGCGVQNTLKPDTNAANSVKVGTSDSKLTKPDAVSSGISRPPTIGKTSLIADQTDPKIAVVEGGDLKRKFTFSSELPTSLATDAGKQSMLRTSSTSDLCTPVSSGVGKQSIFRSGSTSELSPSLSPGLGRQTLYALSASSPGRSTPTLGRDSLMSTPTKDIPGVFSSPGTSREIPSLYTYTRDFSMLGRSGSWSSGSPRDQASQMSASPKDPQFGLGSGKDLLSPLLSRDIQASSRDVSQILGSNRESPVSMGYGQLGLFASRSPYSSHQDFNANIPSKDSSDKLLSPRSLYRSSSLPSSEGDKLKQTRGLDQKLAVALQTIDLEYVEKLVLPPASPMDLSHSELRQAVMDGNCYLVERALVSKRYDFDLPDNKGYTLLMNAVLGGFDDIIVELLKYGANAEVQVKGTTALMLAVEHAECSTVFVLLEMGAHVNTPDNSGETALFKAVRRGDKQILKLVLEHGADFNWLSQERLTALQTAKQYRLADIDVTLTDHIHRVVETFEVEVRRVMGDAARLVSCLFPHRCMSVSDTNSFTVSFQYNPTLPSAQNRGCLLFIAHARFDSEVRCRLYGQCAVQKVTVNGVDQLCITEESNFVMLFHPLITGWNELVIQTQKDPTSKAKLIICAYKTELLQ